MKRIISLLLILTLVTCCSTAMASDFGVSADDFLTVTSFLCSNDGIETKAVNLTADFSFPCNYLAFTTTRDNCGIFVYGETVEGIEIVSTNISDFVMVESFRFCHMIACTATSLWALQHLSDEDFDDKYYSTIITDLTIEVADLMTPLYGMTEFDLYTKRISQEGTLCGYPAVFEIELVDSNSKEYEMRIYIAPDQSMINAYKAH